MPSSHNTPTHLGVFLFKQTGGQPDVATQDFRYPSKGSFRMFGM